MDASGPFNWDLHPDGDRFIVAVSDVPAAVTTGLPGASRNLIVPNWFEELRAKAKRRPRDYDRDRQPAHRRPLRPEPP